MERSEIDHFSFSVRNVYSAQNQFNQFPVITQAERMVDRTVKPLWKKSLELLRSVKALVRRLGLCLMCKEKRSSQSVAKKFLITNSKQLEQNRNAKFCRKNYGVNNRIFREVHQQNLTEMKELRKFQSSTFDTLTRQKFIEDQNTIMELSGRLQELQNEVNCMNDSKDFQDAESVRSGNSHVTSQPGLFL